MKVGDWPDYLLWNVPEDLRAHIVADANARDLTLADAMRSILCERFELECPPVSKRYGKRRSASSNLLLRVQPELFQAVRGEAEAAGVSMRQLILTTLDEHYQEAA